MNALLSVYSTKLLLVCVGAIPCGRPLVTRGRGRPQGIAATQTYLRKPSSRGSPDTLSICYFLLSRFSRHCPNFSAIMGRLIVLELECVPEKICVSFSSDVVPVSLCHCWFSL